MSGGRIRLYIGDMLIGFIVGYVPFFVYKAVVKPRRPIFTLDDASLTGFNLTSDNHLTSFFNVVIRANNPNHKLKLKYRDVRVVIYKGKQKLAEDSVPGFSQRKMNVTFVRAEPVGLNVGLKKGPGFDFGFESGMGYVDFDVRMTATLNVIKTLVVNCVHVVVNITAPPIFVAANSVSSIDDSNNNNGHYFQSVGCFTRYVYAR